MKILVVSQYYTPEPGIVSKVCEGLVSRGHDVTVVTGVPNYPIGKVYEGYEKGQKKEETLGGVKLHRCYEIARRKGVFFRVLNYYSFAWSSKKFIKKLQGDYDVVFSYQTSPVMQSTAAVAYKKKTGTPLVLYCLDLWPESLTIGKICKKSLVYKHYLKVSKDIYTAADKLLITSKPFAKRMHENFGIAEEEIGYLPQHAEGVFDPEACKKEEDGYCDLLFAGNVGMAQSVETIVYAAKELEDYKHIRFHIVGGGTSLEKVKALAEKLNATNVFFHGKHPMDEMPKFYSKADGLLITFTKDEVLAMTMPLKTQSYMAAGKPILCATEGAVADEIKAADCGYVSAAEDVQGLKENILRFASCKDKAAMGARARAYYEANFTKERFLDGLEKALNEVVKKD